MSPLAPSTQNTLFNQPKVSDHLDGLDIEPPTKRIYTINELQVLRNSLIGSFHISDARAFGSIKRSELDKASYGGLPFATAMQLPMFDFRPGTNFSNSRSLSTNSRSSPRKANFPQHNGHGKQSNNRSTSIMRNCVRINIQREVKLSEAENAWKPTHLQEKGAPDAAAADTLNELKKQVRSILNKLTKQNFAALSDQFQKLPIDTNDKLGDVINLVFDKAVDEPNFSECYANLCGFLSKRSLQLVDTTMKCSPFKRMLIEKLQREFEQNVANQNTVEAGLKPLKERHEQMKEKGDKAGIAETKELIAEEESRIRRRLVSTVQFIGELFKLDMLTVRIMNVCVHTLIEHGTDEKLECACKLLTTIGKKLEHTLVDKTKKNDLTAFMNKLKQITERKKNKIVTRTK